MLLTYLSPHWAAENGHDDICMQIKVGGGSYGIRDVNYCLESCVAMVRG